jgi:hypothetical protein
MRVLVLVPTYNESESIVKLLDRLAGARETLTSDGHESSMTIHRMALQSSSMGKAWIGLRFYAGPVSLDLALPISQALGGVLNEVST